MQKLTRLFLLCLMLIAIPIQGIAASTMLYCDSGHHQSMSFDDSEHVLSSDHSSHIKHTDATATEEGDSCAACCIGCAMAMALPSLAVSSPTSIKIHSIFSSHVGYIGDGLERPPRILHV